MSNTKTTAQLRALDAAHHLHPFTDHSNLRAGGARVIVKGDGPYIWDSEGNKILDGMAGLWMQERAPGKRRRIARAFEVDTVTGGTIQIVNGLPGLGLSGSESADGLLRRWLRGDHGKRHRSRYRGEEQSKRES